MKLEILQQNRSLILDKAYKEWNTISTILNIFCNIFFGQKSFVFQINKQ